MSSLHNRADLLDVWILLTLVLSLVLAIPFRDDYSETGPDTGVRSVSIVSNGLNRAADLQSTIVAVLIAAALATVLVVIARSFRRPPDDPGAKAPPDV